MSYHCGIGSGMQAIGYEPRDAHIECDNCGLVRNIVKPGRMGPPAWFLDGKAAPGWKLVRTGETRADYCPRCKDGR